MWDLGSATCTQNFIEIGAQVSTRHEKEEKYEENLMSFRDLYLMNCWDYFNTLVCPRIFLGH